MAPLNSTLIHENAGSKSDLSRYSPILPLKKEGNHANKRKSICSRTNNIQVKKRVNFIDMQAL